MSERETKDGGQATIHIFVNRRKFGVDDGVKEVMTGAEIAGLVGVPAANAVIRMDSGPDKRGIGVEESVHLKQGEQFLVTRKTVEGGCATRRGNAEVVGSAARSCGARHVER
jgi:hypothetical protein